MDLVNPFLKNVQSERENFKVTHCDNAHKKGLDSACAKYFGGIKFKFMSSVTPQKHCVV